MCEAEKLLELAAWYREFAERTGNPAIWESRLRMAEDLEQEAARLGHCTSLRDRERSRNQFSHATSRNYWR
jgi:hypothetical protein